MCEVNLTSKSKGRLRDTDLYRAITDSTLEGIHYEALQFLRYGGSINMIDEETGGTLLHHIADYAHRFLDCRMVSIVYLLCCKGADLNIQDYNCETPLHKVVRKPGAYRILVALMRCGADPFRQNKDGQTPDDILSQEKPDGYQEMQHWFGKFMPGLGSLVTMETNSQNLCCKLNRIEHLLKAWCRVTVVKDGNAVNLKDAAIDRARSIEIFRLLEKHENNIEFALACMAGKEFMIRVWIDEGFVKNVDLNTKDHSFQPNGPTSPEVPQPLLAAVCDRNIYGLVDTLMEIGADSSVRYSRDPRVLPLKPFFFQLICDADIKVHEKIIRRILKDSDLESRNAEGETILFELVRHPNHQNLIEYCLSCGLNVALRDKRGKTARDLAVSLTKYDIVKIIDSHVLKIIVACNFSFVERLVLNNYRDIPNSHVLEQLGKANENGHKAMICFLKAIPEIQAHIKRLFEATDKGKMDMVKKCTTKKLAWSRDRCGRTVLHHAILRKHYEMAKRILADYPKMCNIRDNLGRTCLHYAALFLSDTDMSQLLVDAGAVKSAWDVNGRTADDYQVPVLSRTEYAQLQKEVSQFDLDMFLSDTNFEESLRNAIQSDDLATVQNLVQSLEKLGNISAYSSVLFDCVDLGREQIARFLIIKGCNTNIWKEYEGCDPNNPMCAMMECGHASTSLVERAESTRCDIIVKLVQDIQAAKVNDDNKMSDKKEKRCKCVIASRLSNLINGNCTH